MMKITLLPTAVAASVIRTDDNVNKDNDIVDHTLRTFESHFEKKTDETHFELFDDVDRAVCPAHDHNSGLCGPWGISALQTSGNPPTSPWYTTKNGKSQLLDKAPADASQKNCVQLNNCCKTTANALAKDGDQMLGVTCSACHAHHIMVSAFTQTQSTGAASEATTTSTGTSDKTPVAVCMAAAGKDGCEHLANCQRASTDQVLGDKNNLECAKLQCRDCHDGHSISDTGVCETKKVVAAVEGAVAAVEGAVELRKQK